MIGETVYVVVSRDKGVVAVCKEKDIADLDRHGQINEEEDAGGRPSVYIVEMMIT